jgi:hypothetical protein
VTRFFVLHPAVGSTDETEFEELAPVHLGDAPRCFTCDWLLGPKPWLPPYRAVVRGHGRYLGDIAFGVGSSLLVSGAFRRAWESENLRGLSQFATLDEQRIRPPRLAREAPSFFRVLVAYGRAAVDEGRSLLERSGTKSCERCGNGAVLKSVRGFSIADDTWSGEDMFYAWGLPGTVIVSDRFKQLAERHTLRNVHVTAIEEYVWDPLRASTEL